MLPSAPPSTSPVDDRPEPPFPVALVEEMLRMFGRAVRAHQLYLPNNPTYLRALEQARAAFLPIWAQADELVIEVTDTQLRWEGHPVLNEPDKTTDALPWVLYKDGIRELRLLRDVEQQELVNLIGILTRVRKTSPDEDDLLTLLWEQEFAFVRYRYVDVLLEGAPPLDASEAASTQRLVDPLQVQEPATETILPAGVVNLDDFDATLYFLDEREVEYLRDAIADEYATDLRGNVVGILLDVFEAQADPAIRDEIVGVLDNLLVHLLTAGQLRTVAELLREVTLAANRARDVTPQQRETLLSLPNRMSEPEALSQLLQSLDERAELPEQGDLNDLFEQLRVGALATIFSWMGRLQSPRIRTLLERAAQRLAAAHTSELVRLIGISDREVSLEAIRRAGAMRTRGGSARPRPPDGPAGRRRAAGGHPGAGRDRHPRGAAATGAHDRRRLARGPGRGGASLRGARPPTGARAHRGRDQGQAIAGGGPVREDGALRGLRRDVWRRRDPAVGRSPERQGILRAS